MRNFPGSVTPPQRALSPDDPRVRQQGNWSAGWQTIPQPAANTFASFAFKPQLHHVLSIRAVQFNILNNDAAIRAATVRIIQDDLYIDSYILINLGVTTSCAFFVGGAHIFDASGTPVVQTPGSLVSYWSRKEFTVQLRTTAAAFQIASGTPVPAGILWEQRPDRHSHF